MKKLSILFSFIALFLYQNYSFAAQNWAGTYILESDSAMTSYTLTINENDGQYQAMLDVTGVQVYYQLQAGVLESENKITLTYQNVLDGVFYQQQELASQQQAQLFSLEIQNGQLITQWHQLIVDDELEKKNNSVAFIKQ